MFHRLAAAVALAVAVVAGAAPVDDIELNTARLLAAQLDQRAQVDDSSVTDCKVPETATRSMVAATSGVGALAYRTDRIALRGWLGTDGTEAADKVADVLGPDHVVAGSEAVVFSDAVKPVYYVGLERRDGSDSTDPPPIVELSRRIRHLSGGTITASPVYLLSPASGPTEGWPNGPPVPTSEVPKVRASGLGAGVTAAVYDTGVPSDDDANLPPNLSRLTGQDVEEIDVEAPLDVADERWTGHSVAIADVFNTLAPGLKVEAVKVTEPTGVFTDESAAKRMARTLRAAHQAKVWPELIVNAFGSPACVIDPADPAKGDMVPLGLEMVADAVDLHDQALILASAGNRTSDDHYYPAAFTHPAVISIGALNLAGQWTSTTRSGVVADFSNYGDWVDAWVPGVKLSTRHVRGVAFEPGGKIVDGQALVDGTSFGPSYLGSLIAEQMQAQGQSPLAAWQSVAASGVRCEKSGGGVALALTDLAATATTKGATGTPSC
ncbi:S8/S53 family peptidase [Paractinoplanes rishiriensis]|uniref:Peptidase S8/S53 domain-containing protein n=1 Tax=Paractinoplanes rishiriensis TaxID=1050105 RepID=A0A919K7P7_9ACTN|nr:S8/S53 family peptidase [Actinoplanes rishiriensis]GIF00039.1 hypothetical protein Ari01nite_75030 [Actinoplanes rishiriensis]